MLKRLRDWHARLKAWLVDRIDLVLENLALRHQLMVYERARRLRGSDRLGWCLLSRCWRRWREPLTVVQPTTVLRWRRTPGWRHLRGRRRRRGGRPRIDPVLQVLIQRMDAENLLWGSLRITGELRKLGFTVGNSTVRRYRVRVRRPRPTQSWGTFFSNHAPYLREALLDELRDGTRRLLELLLRPLGAPRGTASPPSDGWLVEVPEEYRGLIEERYDAWLCRCSSCERATHWARDGPNLWRDAA